MRILRNGYENNEDEDQSKPNQDALIIVNLLNFIDIPRTFSSITTMLQRIHLFLITLLINKF